MQVLFRSLQSVPSTSLNLPPLGARLPGLQHPSFYSKVMLPAGLQCYTASRIVVLSAMDNGAPLQPASLRQP